MSIRMLGGLPELTQAQLKATHLKSQEAIRKGLHQLLLPQGAQGWSWSTCRQRRLDRSFLLVMEMHYRHEEDLEAEEKVEVSLQFLVGMHLQWQVVENQRMMGKAVTTRVQPPLQVQLQTSALVCDSSEASDSDME